MLLSIFHFRGIDTYETELGKVNLLSAPNGSGKTSTISALRFVLTGDYTKQDIMAGSNVAEVSLDLPDQNRITRRLVRADGKIKQECYLNGQKSTVKELNSRVLGAFGGNDIGVMKTMLSEEFLEKNLGEKLFSIMPVTLTKETLLGFVRSYFGRELLDSERIAIETNVPDEPFGMNQLKTLYQIFYDERREINGRYKAEKTKADELLGGSEALSLPPMEMLVRKRNEMLRKEGEKAAYQREKANYDQAVRARKETQKKYDGMMKELKTYESVEAPKPEMLQKFTEEKSKCLKAVSAFQNNIGILTSNRNLLQNTLNNLSNNVCPIYPKIVCQTDKSPFQTEIMGQINADNRQIAEWQQKMQIYAEQANKRETLITQYYENANLYAKKMELQKALQSITLPNLPEEPKPVVGVEAEEFKKVDDAIKTRTMIEEGEKSRKNAMTLESQAKTWDELVKAFEPGRGVSQLVLEKAMEPLEVILNETASHLAHQFNVKLKTDGKGLVVYAKFHDAFVSLPLLSSGERVLVLFAVMKLISQITGIRMMAIDSLDRLDQESIRLFFGLLGSADSPFETVLLGSVNHTDTEKIAKSENVSILHF